MSFNLNSPKSYSIKILISLSFSLAFRRIDNILAFLVVAERCLRSWIFCLGDIRKDYVTCAEPTLFVDQAHMRDCEI